MLRFAGVRWWRLGIVDLQRLGLIFIQMLMTEHNNENLRESAIKGLGEIGEASDLPILEGLASSESIARFGQKAARNAIKRLLKRPEVATQPRLRSGENLNSTPHRRSVFICHASEDKLTVVEPLIGSLASHEISYWYDRAEIKWGDSLTGKVNEGLSISEYVLVVLSMAFVDKHWPKVELESALNIEASTGRVVVLPLLVGSVNERAKILQRFPILNHKLYVPWKKPEDVITALRDRLRVNREEHEFGSRARS
jgi:hypothetical protein